MSSDVEETGLTPWQSFTSALVFNAILFGAKLGFFTLIRPYFKAIFEPRTYAPPPSKRAKPLPKNRFLWPLAVWRADYRAIKHTNGMDAYFFVRFLRMMIKVFLPIWFLSWAVLIPVTTVNTYRAGEDNLDKLTFGNVAEDKQTRYAAHLILVWFFTFWIFYNIKNEMRHFIVTRQQHLMEPNHAKSLQANTILVTDIPARYLNHRSLRKLFEELPGGVKKIWINRNLKELPDIYKRRLDACQKLEAAETTLLRIAAKSRLNEKKKGEKPARVDDEKGDAKVGEDADLEASPINLKITCSIVPHDQRPTHRLGVLPFVGKKVDTIEWAREEIRVCNELLEEGRSDIREEDAAEVAEEVESWNIATGSEGGNGKRFTPVAAVTGIPDAVKDATAAIKGKITARISGYGDMKYPSLNSAFITFNKQIAAHLAVQVLAHHSPYRMTGKYNEVSPRDVIWANLNMNAYERKIRTAISYTATVGLAVLWTFPVTFFSAIVNIANVCQRVSWLAWVCTLPPMVVGIISGVLPHVLLAIIIIPLFFAIALLARFEGIPKYTSLELSLMTRFFLLNVVSIFLIIFSSGNIVAFEGLLLENPSSMPSLLASRLSWASTFWLTDIIRQGLSDTAGGFLQIVRLITYYVRLYILGSTPRSVYEIKYVLEQANWGSLWSNITVLAVISITYSTISPVINGLACVTFFLFYQLYKYLFLWVYEQSPASDTGGLFFPKAIQHVFVGLYIEQVCLCTLFFLARNEQDRASAVPEGALMVVLIVITAGFHIIINNSYGPLLYALPLSLKDKTYAPIDEVSTHQHEVHNSAKSANNSSTDIIEQDRDTEADADVDYEDTQTLFPEAGSTEPEEDAQNAAARQTSEEEEFGFAHPVFSRPQRPVWIPRDALGLFEGEVQGCEVLYVSATAEGAIMNGKGKVDVPSADDVPEEVVAIQ